MYSSIGGADGEWQREAVLIRRTGPRDVSDPLQGLRQESVDRAFVLGKLEIPAEGAPPPGTLRLEVFIAEHIMTRSVARILSYQREQAPLFGMPSWPESLLGDPWSLYRIIRVDGPQIKTSCRSCPRWRGAGTGGVSTRPRALANAGVTPRRNWRRRWRRCGRTTRTCSPACRMG